MNWEKYTREELEEEIHSILHPEPDEDGLMIREFPCRRLRQHYGLDFKYMETSIYEGSSMHKYSRLCSPDAKEVHTISSNNDVPTSLFYSALHLLGESIVKYHDPPEFPPQLHYYPPIIFTAWSGFESFVRLKSELLIATVPNISIEIKHFLRELTAIVDSNGNVQEMTKYQPVIDRYNVLIRYGYQYTVDRGSHFWCRLKEANDLRNYYTHLPIQEPRDLSTDDVLNFLESIFLSIIVPSSHLQRTLLLQIFDLYSMWDSLRDIARPISERPFFKDWPHKDPYTFHCNFEGINEDRFPGSNDIERTKQVLKEYSDKNRTKEESG